MKKNKKQTFDLTIEGVAEHIKRLPLKEITKIAYIISEEHERSENMEKRPERDFELTAKYVFDLIEQLPDDELDKLADMLSMDAENENEEN